MAWRSIEEIVLLRGVLATRPRAFRSRESLSPRECLRRAVSFGTSATIHLLVLILLVEAIYIAAPVVEDGFAAVRMRPEGGAPSFAKVEAAPRPEPTPATETVGAGGSRPVHAEPAETANPLSEQEPAPASGVGLVGDRSANGRKAGVGRYGGDSLGEAAVERGLEWLANHQSRDGRWSGKAYVDLCPNDAPCGRPDPHDRYSTGLTGLALLAFLGAGYTADSGPYQGNVSHAIEGLIAKQDASGLFPGSSLYDHGVCTLALAEACALTRDERLLPPLRRAVEAIGRAQQVAGGWWYSQEESDKAEFTLSIWNVMALKAAALAGVDVPEAAFDRARGFVRRSTFADGSVNYGRGFTTHGSTLAALFARCVLDMAEPESVRKGIACTAKGGTAPEGNDGWRGCYEWYYRTLVFFQLQGRGWKEWNAFFRAHLVATQRKEGDAAGSWALEDQGLLGPVYATAMSVLMLEVYYRYLPLQSGRGLVAPKDDLADLPGPFFPPLPDPLRAGRQQPQVQNARSVVAALVQAAERQKGPARAETVRMLGQFRFKEARPFLTRMLEDPDAAVRAAARRALDSMK